MFAEQVQPVRDLNGHAVWLVSVIPGELTCLGCGETFHESDACPRCGLRDDGVPRTEFPPAVPTLSYLRDGEYRIVK